LSEKGWRRFKFNGLMKDLRLPTAGVKSKKLSQGKISVVRRRIGEKIVWKESNEATKDEEKWGHYKENICSPLETEALQKNGKRDTIDDEEKTRRGGGMLKPYLRIIGQKRLKNETIFTENLLTANWC